ncbi:MAG: GGDEF domain-containing protein [Chloroflexaceae bacterium]|nr:GGDEF domain-containing protein [Chloroflexaceae bacterium]
MARSPRQSIWLSLIAILIIAILDSLTGYLLRFSVFYVIPIALVTWMTHPYMGFLVALLSTLSGQLTDFLGGKPVVPFVDLWTVLVVIVFYSIMIVLLDRLKQALQEAEQLARTDVLTSLANSRAFFEMATEEVQRSQQLRYPLTLAYIDCDNFKLINDTLGHQAGDELLRIVGETLRDSVRPVDIPARLGGDEFVVLLPNVSSHEAQMIAPCLRSCLLETMQEGNWSVTFSMGVVSATVLADINILIQQADALMYQVKHRGGNSIAYATLPSSLTR